MIKYCFFSHALRFPFLKQVHMATDPSCSPFSNAKKWEIKPSYRVENVSQDSVATVEDEINQLKLSHSEHHFDCSLRLLHLFQVVALIWREVWQFLHSLVFFVQVVVVDNIVFVQAINVDTDDDELLKAIPNDVLGLRVTEERNVMRLE